MKNEILIVEDDALLALDLKEILEEGGYHVLSIENSGSGALAFIASHKPTLVLMDIQLDGEMSGTAAAYTIAHSYDIPVIFVSAHADKATLEKAAKALPYGYIVKPYKEEDLYSSIEMALSKHKDEQLKKEEVHKLGEKNAILEELAITDALTGLYNRRYFDRRFFEEFERSKRDHQIFNLLIIDIDYFKLYNDAYGHAKGDETLQAVAACISRAFTRASDFAFRIGGEEFAAIFATTNEHDASDLASTLVKSVEALQIEHHKSNVSKHVTISAGLTSLEPNHQIVTSEIFNHTDKKLYQAKNLGRNRVVI
jgi:two-component system, chemotaxis family, response regulator WspR